MSTKEKSTRKVGSSDSASATAVAEPPAEAANPKKPQFDLATALDEKGGAIALDDNGRLTGVPANWDTGYHWLGRSAFANRTIQLQHKLFLFDKITASRAERREELVGDIEEAAVGISPEKKKVKKAQRLMKQLESLKAELEAEGIEF